MTLPILTGRFVVLCDGVLCEYSSTADLPDRFDNIIAFLPDYPLGPHTPDQHEEIERYSDVLRDLLSREKM